MKSKVGTLIAPELPNTLPANSKWLSGQGAGTWFCIELADNELYRIMRFTPAGELDCDRLFKINGVGFDLNQPYEFVHISHCSLCKIEQGGKVYEFNYVH